MFGRKQRRIRELEQVATGLQSMLSRMGGERGEVARERAALLHIRRQIDDARAELAPLRADVGVQRSGVFRYHHPLSSSSDYQTHLELAQSEMTQLIKDGNATEGGTECTFNSCSEQGDGLLADWRVLMLRAYNTEAEICLVMVRASSASVARKRLERAAEDVNRLGERLGVRLSPRYTALRVYELELTVDHLRKKLEERRTKGRKAA
ncbi:DUF4041 domain-containing protein [Lentzea tibetensis]|uniref:DUF4041 domain-containing protein n=1 Tax=Lentzea tibetensis TaxID=2591470 RepID=A0A563EWP0_9PSEU|nr:DUF4041 domain-containing protein [Lentzea tibetensis]TWP52089.1 DUF4041 domain-containing protein [Lentzea tibetensis]